MGGDASAFTVLGLEPGADSAAIERAYKRLIKQHHPDREGGDSARAAEINRAYRELRSERSGDALEFADDEALAGRHHGWLRAGLLAFAAMLLLTLIREPIGAL